MNPDAARAEATFQLSLLLGDNGFVILGTTVPTRMGTLDVVARKDDLIVFGHADDADTRTRVRLRRSAVAWMATNPALQQGVRRYRFDTLIGDAYTTDAL